MVAKAGQRGGAGGSGGSSGSGGAGSGSAAGTAVTAREPRPRERREGPVEFWFEKSQAFAAAMELGRRVLHEVPAESPTGAALRQASVRLVGAVASAVSTAREQLPARLMAAQDEANAVAGLFTLHAEESSMDAAARQPYRESLSAVGGLLYGLRRSITQES